MIFLKIFFDCLICFNFLSFFDAYRYLPWILFHLFSGFHKIKKEWSFVVSSLSCQEGQSDLLLCAQYWEVLLFPIMYQYILSMSIIMILHFFYNVSIIKCSFCVEYFWCLINTWWYVLQFLFWCEISASNVVSECSENNKKSFDLN